MGTGVVFQNITKVVGRKNLDTGEEAGVQAGYNSLVILVKNVNHKISFKEQFVFYLPTEVKSMLSKRRATATISRTNFLDPLQALKTSMTLSSKD